MSKRDFIVFRSDGTQLNMNELDKEICTLMNQKLNDSQYCTTMVPYTKYCELNGIVDDPVNKRNKWDYETLVISRNWYDIFNDTVIDGIPEYYTLGWKPLLDAIMRKYLDISILVNMTDDKTEFVLPTQQFIGEYIQYQLDVFINNVILIIEYCMLISWQHQFSLLGEIGKWIINPQHNFAQHKRNK